MVQVNPLDQNKFSTFIPSSCGTIRGGPAGDTLSSAGTSETEKETWGSAIFRWVCFVPNLMWTCLKRILSVISCGFLCGESAAVLSPVEELKKIHKDWLNPDVNNQEKQELWDQFCQKHPKAKDEMVQIYLEQLSEQHTGHKATDEDRAEWIKDFGTAETKNLFKSLKNCDTALLKDLIDRFEEKAEESK